MTTSARTLEKAIKSTVNMSREEKEELTRHISTTYTRNPEGKKTYHHPQYGFFRVEG